MPATTSVWKLPYPLEADPADVPVDIKALADRLEILLSQVGATGDLVWSVLATRPGAVLCDGTLYNSVSDPTFAALFAAIGTTYGGTGASSFAVPDVRGRLLVCRGTHTDVNAVAKNDGVAVASRSPKHNHSHGLAFAGTIANTGTVSADHAHYTSGQTGGRSAQHRHNAMQGSGGDVWSPSYGTSTANQQLGPGVWYDDTDHSHSFGGWSGGISANHVHNITPAGTITGGIGPAGPTDAPGYIVENCFIVK